MEEERRLCYVGLTRAKKNLYLSCARRRMLYNQITHNAPSVFLREIPSRLMKDDFRQMQRTGYSTPVYSPRPQAPAYGGGSRPVQQSPVTAKVGGLNIPGVSKGFGASVTGPAAETNLVLYKPGDRVLHKKFGTGTVQSVSGKGAGARITIAFPVYGVREFSLAIAPIAKLEE